MSYKVQRWRGYEPWGVTNPFVFANYGQPQRHRGYVSPMVYQTQPPSLRNDHLGDPDYLEEDRARARRMEYVAVASLVLSAWSMWFFYTKMSGPTRNGRRVRRNGRRSRRPRKNSAQYYDLEGYRAQVGQMIGAHPRPRFDIQVRKRTDPSVSHARYHVSVYDRRTNHSWGMDFKTLREAERYMDDKALELSKKSDDWRP